MRTALATVLALLLLLTAGATLAAGPAPPAGATATPLEDRDVLVYMGPDPTKRNETHAAGAEETLWVAIPVARPSENATAFLAYVNVTFFNATFSASSVVSGANATANGTTALLHQAYGEEPGADHHFVGFSFVAPPEGAFSYHLTVQAFLEEGNATRAFGTVVLDGGAPVVAPAPVAPGLPWLWILGALVVVGGAGGAVAWKRSRDRARMNALHRRRSQALREDTLEQQKAKKPAEVERVQQEIRQQEVVREKRREVQILEAKRADALKTIDLLQKRHASGALSKHQFDQMVAKKRADLERIEAEIREFEAQDGASAA